jgi:cyclophilin family peptidyl-prolyl cis-trans isomerase
MTQRYSSTTQFLILVVITIVLIVIAKMIGGNVPQTTSSPTPSNEGAGVTQNQATQATITTDKGDITIELYPNDAPKTVENFTTLAKRNYYNGIIFHRVMKDFMIQTGDPTGKGTGGESAFGGAFADEINSHKIDVGTVAMANSGPNTNGSQFFIVTEEPQPHLDGKHTVFGKATAGMDVVRAIAAVPVDQTTQKPLTDIKIQSISIK